MIKDKRKAVRRPLRYSAWVALAPDELHGCVMSDISDSGARLDIDETKTIPDQFTLLLSSNGSARRTCRVVWRKPRQIGVSFEKGLNHAEQATLVPKSDADKGPSPEPVRSDAEPAKSA
jgi:PilZ domain